MRRFLFSLLMAVLVPMAAGAQEPYAVLSNGNSVLTFYYDNQKAARNGMDVGPFILFYDNNLYRDCVSSGWDEHRDIITSVVFDDSFAGCSTLASTAYWFYEFKKLSSITGISNLKTDNVTDMQFMFRNCSGLTSLDVTGFKTDNVTNMNWMFTSCSGLTSLDVTGFKTDKVTNMDGMFHGCSSLKSIDVTGFKTENVTKMRFMFEGCNSMTSIDVTGFKTNNVTDMSNMFYGCSGLTSLDMSGFKLDKLEDLRFMFEGCSRLTTIYSNEDWYADNRYGYNMFYGCTSLKGGEGTEYDESMVGVSMAHPDSQDNPGYFTRKGGTVEWAEGDLNHDGKVDAADMVKLANIIMGK